MKHVSASAEAHNLNQSKVALRQLCLPGALLLHAPVLALFRPLLLCQLWHPACPAVTEDEDPPSQSCFSQFSFQHQCPAWGYWPTLLGQRSVCWGCVAQHQLSLGDGKTHHSSGVCRMMDQKMGKTWSSTEEVLCACFELITPKVNKICKAANDAKLTGAPVRQRKKGMINVK